MLEGSSTGPGLAILIDHDSLPESMIPLRRPTGTMRIAPMMLLVFYLI